MKKINITYIGGGSKAWAHKYFADLLTQGKLEGELRLYDIDVPAAERNREYFYKLIKDNPDKIKSSWECKSFASIDDALPGSDFVIISILPFTFWNMRNDVHYPEKYGIWQSVGDTAGPGGYSRALRTIPSFVFFAEKIKEFCPGAWVINYTNPMSMCMNTLFYTFPEIKAFGCCHEVFGTQSILARVFNMYSGLSEAGRASFKAADLEAVKNELAANGKDFNEFKSFGGIGRHDITTNVQGINHFTWINRAEYDGTDLFELYTPYIKMFRENFKERCGKLTPPIIKRFRNVNSVKFELFEKYGVAAAAGDRHLAEFIPDVYLPTKHVYKNGFELTPVWGRILVDNILRARIKVLNKPFLKAKIKGSGEEGVFQITAICGLGDRVTNVNLLNKGQLPNIVEGTAVETNATFSENRVEALYAGEMTDETAALVNVHAKNQKEFVENFIKSDKNALAMVFCSDPAVKRIGSVKGKKLFEEMIDKNKECLEKFLK
ncbi:MAG: alpha-glucosidase/alpha-galactosidase [Oscillospiraceae bacterium]|nr:alpha-glucosidase/alpha-galactosidase [Oscillospiraceae bacterium]